LLPRAAADTRGQHSALRYTGAAEGGAGEEERRRDEETGERAKEVARAGGGKAAGAWVIGGRDGRRRAIEGGCDGRALRCGAGERHQQHYLYYTS
jgi:hypothetical protein